MTCPGGLSRVSGRPHPYCRGDRHTPACERYSYGATDMLPALQVSGQPTCPNKVHAGTVRQTTQSRAPTCGGSGIPTAGVIGNTAPPRT